MRATAWLRQALSKAPHLAGGGGGEGCRTRWPALSRRGRGELRYCPLPLCALGRPSLPLPALEQTLTAALADPAPHRLDDGNAILPGFDAELDAERALRDDSRRVLATLQLDYAQRYGVASLKIRHHAQLGYVIEAPAAAVEKLRDFPELTLRQGMANGARFTTPELSDLDRRISEAGERAAARERAVFAHLVADSARPCRRARRLRRRAGRARCRPVRGEARRSRHLVPPAW